MKSSPEKICISSEDPIARCHVTYEALKSHQPQAAASSSRLKSRSSRRHVSPRLNVWRRNPIMNHNATHRPLYPASRSAIDKRLTGNAPRCRMQDLDPFLDRLLVRDADAL